MTTNAPGYSTGLPGFSSTRFSAENQAFFQTFFMGDVVFDPAPVVASTARDTLNTDNTLVLRPGLVMAKLDSNGQWTNYDPDGTDGSQEARGVLGVEVYLLDPTTAAAAVRSGQAIAMQGKCKAAALIGLDDQARNQLSARGFFFDDDVWFPASPYRRNVSKAASYTVLASDHATRFNTLGATGAVTFTLPTIAPGLKFQFLNVVDQNMIIASAAGDDLIVVHDLSADSVTFSTSSQKIGACVEVEGIYVGTTLKWLPTLVSVPLTATGGGATATLAS